MFISQIFIFSNVILEQCKGEKMNISNSFNTNFGKSIVLDCQIKNRLTKEKEEATLYKYNISDISELRELREYDIPFNVDTSGYSDVYVLQNDDNDEIISCAQTSNHFRSNSSSLCGFSTLIEEMNSNKNYANPMEPLLAGIVREAQNKFHSSITFAIDPKDIRLLSKMKLSSDKLGENFITEKRFNTIIDNAEEHSNINFYV